MEKMHEHTIYSSIRDVVHILDSAPVKPDMVPQITAYQIMNRAPIAHLSIERAFKSLIRRSGVETKEIHNLLPLYRQLTDFNPEAARFLSGAFGDAVSVYRYRINATGFEHFKSLDDYLSSVGSRKAFNAMRYWEFQQSLDEGVLHRISLPIHREILCALQQIFMAPSQRWETVTNRIERTVRNVMFDAPSLAYSQGSEKERTVRWYVNWLFKEHSTCREALDDAVRQSFNIKDDFINKMLLEAYDALLKSDDPAVRYVARTVNVLPLQPRDPGKDTSVEWLGPTRDPHSGLVYSPAGTHLGDIDRGPDGLWYITPMRNGLLQVSAIASSQMDARCHLTELLTQQVRVAIGGGIPREFRLVGEGNLPFALTGSRHAAEMHIDDLINFDLDFWDENHGIQVGHVILVESGPTKWNNMLVLEGEVVWVDRQLVSVVGTEYLRAVGESGT